MEVASSSLPGEQCTPDRCSSAMECRPPRQLVGVSVPRSGHHFLERLFIAVLGEETFQYCEFYTPADCCKCIPCTAMMPWNTLMLQKSHDLDGSTPNDLAEVLYLIQFRNPVLAVLSDRELYATIYGEKVASDREDLEHWLANKASYYMRFYRKWMARPIVNAVYIPYDDLVARPQEYLAEIISRTGMGVPLEAIEARIADIRSRQAHAWRPDVSERTLANSRLFDPDLFAQFESLVHSVAGCAFGTRLLPSVDFEGTGMHVYHRIANRAAAGEFELAAELAAELLLECPDSPMALYERGNNLGKSGASSEAARLLSEAFERKPYHQGIASACTATLVGAAIVPARALVEQLPSPQVAGPYGYEHHRRVLARLQAVTAPVADPPETSAALATALAEIERLQRESRRLRDEAVASAAQRAELASELVRPEHEITEDGHRGPPLGPTRAIDGAE